MPTLEISENTKKILDAFAEKYGVSPTELIKCAVEMTDKINTQDIKEVDMVETLIAFQMSFLGCAGNMLKNMNASKMVFEARPISITIQDMESTDYKEEGNMPEIEMEPVNQLKS